MVSGWNCSSDCDTKLKDRYSTVKFLLQFASIIVLSIEVIFTHQHDEIFSDSLGLFSPCSSRLIVHKAA